MRNTSSRSSAPMFMVALNSSLYVLCICVYAYKCVCERTCRIHMDPRVYGHSHSRYPRTHAPTQSRTHALTLTLSHSLTHNLSPPPIFFLPPSLSFPPSLIPLPSASLRFPPFSCPFHSLPIPLSPASSTPYLFLSPQPPFCLAAPLIQGRWSDYEALGFS